VLGQGSGSGTRPLPCSRASFPYVRSTAKRAGDCTGAKDDSELEVGGGDRRRLELQLHAWCGSPPSPSGGGGAPAAAGSYRRTSFRATGGLPDMALGRWGDDITTRWALAEPSPSLWIQRNRGVTRFWRRSCSHPLRRPFRDKPTASGSRDFSRTPVWVVSGRMRTFRCCVLCTLSSPP
jgi:hypothetical protein